MATTQASLSLRTTSLWVGSSGILPLFLLIIFTPQCVPQLRPDSPQYLAWKAKKAFRPGPTPPLPLSLDGDGRACQGHVHLTITSFYWKWHWATCRAGGWTVVAQDKTSWTLKLKQTPAEVKACLGVRYVKVEATDLENDSSAWGLAGMLGEHADNVHDPISCDMF